MSDQPIRKSNPIRDSKNRIKLGVFGINGNGAAFTFHPDRFKCTWDANVRLAQKAEKLGLEGFVSAAHWKSFGGDNHYSGDLMETFAWAGGIAAVTERIGIISTIHVTLIHPVFAAKAEATVDLISKGRAGLNLVLGWYPPDMQLWGLDVKEHGDRFAKCLESMSDADLAAVGQATPARDQSERRVRTFPGGMSAPSPGSPNAILDALEDYAPVRALLARLPQAGSTLRVGGARAPGQELGRPQRHLAEGLPRPAGEAVMRAIPRNLAAALLFAMAVEARAELRAT